MPAIFLAGEGEPVSPFELFKYKVVVTSYNYVASELGRIQSFMQGLEDVRKGKTDRFPERPTTTLLSGIFEADGAKKLGEYLVLDEAHTIKNTDGLTYAAIELLRSLFATCLMISGTPIDNTWVDSYALLSLLHGHPITSLARMRLAFTDLSERSRLKKAQRGGLPTDQYLNRIIQMLDAVTLRRPPSTIQSMLQPLSRDIVELQLPRDDLDQSNRAFKAYKQALDAARTQSRGNAQGGSGTGTRSGGNHDSMSKWSNLVKAQQHAYHPLLVEIMHLERDALLAGINNDEAADNPASNGKEAQKLLKRWRKKLQKDENWRSARVDAVIDVFNRHRDMRPYDAVLIVDESVFFLDILEIALENMAEPVPSFRYDGRQDSAERDLAMRDFHAATGSRVMLASRGTGGQGLNVQCANVLIRCGPWWSVSWEEQAEAQVHRLGQLNPVFVYELSARNCDVEGYKREVGDRKKRTNTAIMQSITRSDDAQLGTPRFIS